MAIADVPSLSSGYLALSAGEVVEVEYKGCDENGDRGWLFGCSLATGNQGWFVDTVVSQKPCVEAQVATECSGTFADPVVVGSEVKAFTDIPSLEVGYLALALGEVVKVQYVGKESTEEDGWLFGISVATGQQGWVFVAAISKLTYESALVLNADKAVDDDAKYEAPSRFGPQPVRSCLGSVEATANSEKTVVEHSVTTPACCPSATSSLARTATIAEQRGLKLLGECAPHGVAWQYPLCDKELGCFVGFLPGALERRHAKKLFELVCGSMEDIGWETPVKEMNGKVTKFNARRTKWLVAPGCRCPYSYGGPGYGEGHARVVTVKPMAFPPWMQEIMQTVMPLCGLADPDAWPNCCSLNHYSLDGECHWHADDEELFQGVIKNCSIISLSLGAKRVFQVRRSSDKHIPCKFELNGGDLCSMEGMTQKHYQHAAFRQPGGSRLNLTWRWIVAHQCGRK